MNASTFMDKQIMDLSRSKSSTDPINNSNDFIDLMNPQSEEDSDGGSSSLKKKEDILASYDFQPISRSNAGVHSLSSSDAPAATAAATATATATATSPIATARAWNSLDSKPNSTPFRRYSSVDPVESDKIVLDKGRKVNDSALLSEVDRTMKKYTDSVLHAIDSLSARLSQLKSRTCNLDYSVDDLKVSIGNNQRSADGKMRQLENILLEVQTGMQDIKDKQEVMEGHMKLAKLQISKVEKSSESLSAVHVEPAQQLAASAPPQQFPVAVPQPMASLPPNAPPPPPPQQNIHPSPPVTAQFPPSQIPAVPPRDAYFQPTGQPQEAPSQQYQIPPPAQHQQQPPAPDLAPQPQPYSPAPAPPYPEAPQLPQQQPPPQFQPHSLGHLHEESPYMPAQTYPPNLRQPTLQPSSGPPQSHLYHGSPSMYEPPPPSRSSSGFSSYSPPSEVCEPYSYGAPPSHYGSGSSIKQQPHSPGIGGGSSNYPQIPAARILPLAVPTAAAVGGGSNSVGSGNRVPIDDVVDKVTNMGFPREHVRATVRRLTENGQSVDLNVVLDKLMNDGDVPRQGGWFGR